MASADHIITDEASLRALYGMPSEAAVLKQVDHLHPHYQAMIRAAPFAVLATSGPNGVDTTPRGDAPGFIEIVDDRTLLLPDRRGNNRIDALRNILANPNVSLLFLIPGVGETLRVNGRATICTDPALLARFVINGKEPASVLVIRVTTVFFQCAKAVIRSRLWDPAAQVPKGAVPSSGTILKDMTSGKIGGEQYDRDLPGRLAATLY
jgi:PPOX class probable FMN-dependent enzyme